MREPSTMLPLLREPHLAAHATSAHPVWLWSIDGSEILWANPAGAAIFGADNVAGISGHKLSPDDPVAAQIARIAASLPLGGKPRLERLRGFGAGFGRMLLCACSRIAVEHRFAALVVAAEIAGPNLSLTERVRRLIAGWGDEAAVFSPDGKLIAAGPKAAALLGSKTTLAAVGAGELTSMAADKGHATGASDVGNIAVDRIGAGTNTVLLVSLPPAAQSAQPVIPHTVAPESAPEPEMADLTPIAEAIQRIESEPEVQEPDVEPSEVQAPPAKASDAAPVEAPKAAASGEAIKEPVVPERRHPLRFVWNMDADGRFNIGSEEFTAVIGHSVAAAFGRPWNEITQALGLDPEGYVMRAITSRDTWSGITVMWPVEGTNERLPVELSGLPVYDRDRAFRGYRGFGVCRDTIRIAHLMSERSAPAPVQTQQAPAAEPKPAEQRPPLTVVPRTENVLPFRAAAPEAKPAPDSAASLSPVEQSAFQELAKQLSARLNEPESAPQQPAIAENTSPATVILATPAENERPVLDRLPVGVLVYRHDQFLFANRAFLEWTGHDSLQSFAEAGGLDTLLIDDGKPPVEGAGGQTLTIEKPNGERCPAEARLFALPWEGATAMALVLIVTRDTARARHADGEIRALKTQLDTARAELASAQDQIEKATSAKSDFLAKVSHDIRAPLSTVIGFSEMMMEERFGPVGNERYLAYLKDIHSSGNQLVALLNDLLDLSKIESGKMEMSFASVNLNDITQQSVAMMQPQANRERIIIRTSLPPTLPQVVADARSVRQIILNLLSNSIKFTGAGGQVIVSTALNDNGDVVMRVRDTGTGMTDKDIESALEPFRQLATAAPSAADGTGLGLPLTKALAEANRASFRIKSAVNSGTLAEVVFPAARVVAG